jgi:hypothetical protein
MLTQAMDLEDSIDPTWIVSGQSAEQQALIEKHPADRPVYVEGAFRVWMQRVCINYFILRAEPRPVPKPKEKDPDGTAQHDNDKNIFNGSGSRIWKIDFYQLQNCPITKARRYTLYFWLKDFSVCEK